MGHYHFVSQALLLPRFPFQRILRLQLFCLIPCAIHTEKTLLYCLSFIVKLTSDDIVHTQMFV